MRSSLSYRRRRHRGARLVLMVVMATAVAVVWSLYKGSDAGGSAPPLNRSQEAPVASGNTVLPAEIDSAGNGAREAAPAPREHVEPAAQEQERPAAAHEAAEEPEDLAAAQAEVARAEAAGDTVRVRSLLGPLVLDSRYPEKQRRVWLDRLEVLNRSLVYDSSRRCAGFRRIQVRRRDNYTYVCQRLWRDDRIRVAPGMLAKINNVSPRRLRGGQWIKVPEEPVSLVVLKKEFRIFVVLGKVPVTWYPVGLGKDDSTPTGTFTIGGKAKNPTWTDPRTGRTYRYGEEGHLVGSRWMRFFRDGVSTELGIHGTSSPESIGRAESDGCIRMHNRNVEELFDLVPEGTPVHVRT